MYLPQSYKIAIAAQGLDQLGQSMTSLNLGKKVLVVSNPTIERHYGERDRIPVLDVLPSR